MEDITPAGWLCIGIIGVVVLIAISRGGKKSSPSSASSGWYIHYWSTPKGQVAGFVDSGPQVGTSPYGGSESIKGPYSSQADAQRDLNQMCANNY